MGAVTTRECPHCGKEVLAEAIYCIYCETNIPSSAPAPAKAKLWPMIFCAVLFSGLGLGFLYLEYSELSKLWGRPTYMFQGAQGVLSGLVAISCFVTGLVVGIVQQKRRQGSRVGLVVFVTALGVDCIGALSALALFGMG